MNEEDALWFCGGFSRLRLKNMKIHFKLRQEKYFLINKLIYLEYLCAHKHMQVHLFIVHETLKHSVYTFFFINTLCSHIGLAM